MKKNIGTTDRIIRLAAGLVAGFLVLSGTISGTPGIILGVFSVALLATSAMSICPLYGPLKISTLKKQ